MSDFEIMERIDVITPYLALGGIAGARNAELIQKHHITHILTVLDEDMIHLSLLPDTRRTVLVLNDNDDERVDDVLIKGDEFIRQVRSDGGVVLVHCGAGISRSVSVVLYHLLMQQPKAERDLDKELSALQSIRPIAQPNFWFMGHLRVLIGEEEREQKPSESYRLAIVGSRDFTDTDTFYRGMQKLVNEWGKPSLVVSGGARGADTMGAQWARGRSIEVQELLLDWSKHGRAAGNLRNTDIVKGCDKLVAFHKNDSRGTHDSINKAYSLLGITNVRVIRCS